MISEARPKTAAVESITAANRSFYDALWSGSRLTRPQRFNTWPLIAELLPSAPARLEVGPGLRPRLPVAGTHFLDLSLPAIDQLNARGGLARAGVATSLPYRDDSFDLVCAFDVIEHVVDDGRVFSELSRVLKKDGTLILSVPLHGDFWTDFDDFVGHVRRYQPRALLQMLQTQRLQPERSACYGLQPASPRLLACGIWFLTHRRLGALFWYNNLLLPLRLLFQRRLRFVPGLLDTDRVGEVVLVCRRADGAGAVV